MTRVLPYLICIVVLLLVLAYQAWTLHIQSQAVRELTADRERLIERIGYLQNAPPRPQPGPVAGPDTPSTPRQGYFRMKAGI